MKKMINLMTAFSTALLMALPVQAQVTLDSRIGELSFTKEFATGYPTDETVTKLYDEMDFQRATQAYMWSIPLIGFVWWQDHQEDMMGTKNGQLVYAPDYDTKFPVLTLNATTPYVWGFIDLQPDGPFVIEVPPGNQVRGAASDMWQIQISQMTRAGKYLFVGPNQEVPPQAESEGYIITHSSMNNFFFAIRLMPDDEKEREALMGKDEGLSLRRPEEPEDGALSKARLKEEMVRQPPPDHGLLEDGSQEPQP